MTGASDVASTGREVSGHQPRTPDNAYFQGARPLKTGTGPATALLERFPPRLVPERWAWADQTREEVIARLSGPPFLTGSAGMDQDRQRGLRHLLGWLEAQPGHSWQGRWARSGADAMGHAGWRALPAAWLSSAGTSLADPGHVSLLLGRGILLLVRADVIRPSLGWLLSPGTPRNLVTELSRTRDPAGFAQLRAIAEADLVNTHTMGLALRRVAAIVAAKGGQVADITAGDCLELLRVAEDVAVGSEAISPYFYQLLRRAGLLADGPPAGRALRTQGQLSCSALVDRYGIECRPVRDLLVGYLAERRPAVDYATLHKLSYTLGRLFWRDLELHHPGMSSLRLAPDVAASWKQRLATKTKRSVDDSGAVTHTLIPRVNAVDHLMTVRAFYLDLIEWAVEDPARWGPRAHPSPVSETEIAPQRKARAHRKSRMDQRTRERLPVLPALVAHVQRTAAEAAERLAAASATEPGEVFSSGGETLRRAVTRHGSAGKIWAADPATGKRRDLGLEEHRAFWTWAAIEVLRHTGVRIEEMAELSHHSFVEYRLPSTGELIPLLHVVPSKTDAERLLVISPELADVLSIIIKRVSDEEGAVPLVVAYDYHDRVWNPPSPLLFQRRFGGEHRPIGGPPVRELLAEALAASGLTDASGGPLIFTPHDFRRIFVTDAILHGMPPHIAQLIVGHRDIATTMGYKAVYPEEAINSHRAFLARRRSLRPSEEYRTPTDEEWEEFVGHSVDCTTGAALAREGVHVPGSAALPSRLSSASSSAVGRLARRGHRARDQPRRHRAKARTVGRDRSASQHDRDTRLRLYGRRRGGRYAHDSIPRA